MRVLIFRRIAAYGLDCILLFVVLAPLSFGVQRWAGFVPASGFEIWLTLLMSFSIPSWVYFALGDRSQRGATIGKRLVGIRVRTASHDRVGNLRALIRTAVKLLPWELVHVCAFALSAAPGEIDTVQVVGLAAANLLILLYLGLAIATRGRASVHDFAASTHVGIAVAEALGATQEPDPAPWPGS